MQYTLRNIPESLDHALRERAKAEGKSLNEVAVEALARAITGPAEPTPQRDLADVAGTWVEDPAFDAALSDQHQIDEALWR
jgi:plasmid stability protein